MLVDACVFTSIVGFVQVEGVLRVEQGQAGLSKLLVALAALQKGRLTARVEEERLLKC